jgi:hypothetical protein
VVITSGLNIGLDFIGVICSICVKDIGASGNVGGLSRRGLTLSTERGLENTAT